MWYLKESQQHIALSLCLPQLSREYLKISMRILLCALLVRIMITASWLWREVSLYPDPGMHQIHFQQSTEVNCVRYNTFVIVPCFLPFFPTPPLT